MGERVAGLVLCIAAGCATEFTPEPCAGDSECGAPLRIGHHSALSGPYQAYGTSMKLGIELAFEEQNAAGGIRGRTLELVVRDDAYDPATAENAARSLLDVQVTQDPPRCPSTATPVVTGQAPVSMTALARGDNAVLAMIGNVGTPTVVRAAPVVVETQTLYFGALTGADTVLRDNASGPCKRFIFNVRASFAQEARATLEYFKRKMVGGSSLDHKNLISFDQNDAFGQSGYEGFVQAYKELIGPFPGSADDTTPITRFRYSRNDDGSVPAQAEAAIAYLARLLDDKSGVQSVGILMADNVGAAAEFIKRLRDWQFDNDQASQKATRLRLYFSNLSFVGPDALAARLGELGSSYADGVVVSQVVPNYQRDTSDVVTRYNELIAAAGRQPSFISLEGYIAARVLIAGLERHEGPFTPESLVADFESLPDLGLGIGATAGFSPINHQYSQSVWGTIIQPDGSFENLYFWGQGSPIQFFD